MASQMNEQIQKLTIEYLDAFMAFCIKRTNNTNQAEELAQEIAYQCIIAIKKGRCKDNFNAYLWSIAHNTYKRWCKHQTDVKKVESIEILGEIVSSDTDINEGIIKTEVIFEIRKQLSVLARYYRDVLVSFYYDELSIRQISKKYALTEEMVKYYLQKGREKIKEAYDMPMEYGKKSFKATEFSIYYSGIDFSNVNIWSLFKRKLPGQIALICYEKAKTISEISLETGTPSIYIEDEIQELMDGGVMISPVKDKYRTNFFIMRVNARKQIEEQFRKMYENYLLDVKRVYDKYLLELRNTGIFKHEVNDNRYAWLLIHLLNQFAPEYLRIDDNDYPVILSCGARAFIFAEETISPLWAGGSTPTNVDGAVVRPVDINIFGNHRHQDNLRSKEKSQALFDIYNGKVNEEDKEIYSKLIKEGYVSKRDGKMVCEVPVINNKCMDVFKKMNEELKEKLNQESTNIYNNIYRIVKNTIPEQLKDYAKGYTTTEIMAYSGIFFSEALYQLGLLEIPKEGDLTPVACYITITQ